MNRTVRGKVTLFNLSQEREQKQESLDKAVEVLIAKELSA